MQRAEGANKWTNNVEYRYKVAQTANQTESVSVCVCVCEQTEEELIDDDLAMECKREICLRLWPDG